MAQRPLDLAGATDGSWRLSNRAPTIVDDSGRRVLRFDERSGGGMAWSTATTLLDGDIEVDVRGRDLAQKSFVGVAYHVRADTSFEVVWLRPFNFQSADSSRRAHSVQYAYYPSYPWQRLREQHPGSFEAAVPASVLPNEWVHMHLRIRGAHLWVYLNHSPTPTLDVETLSDGRGGGVGLWVGDNSTGDFANLVVYQPPVG